MDVVVTDNDAGVPCSDVDGSAIHDAVVVDMIEILLIKAQVVVFDDARTRIHLFAVVHDASADAAIAEINKSIVRYAVVWSLTSDAFRVGHGFAHRLEVVILNYSVYTFVARPDAVAIALFEPIVVDPDIG